MSCYLWFPDTGGPLDAVHLTSLELEEWSGLADWVQPRSQKLPALASLLAASLPVRVPPANIPALAAECERVDWDTLAGPALGGFAALSQLVSQAVGQVGAGLRFTPDA